MPESDLWSLNMSSYLTMPATDFAYKRETMAKVKKNYHVILGEDHFQNSVSHVYIGKIVKLI
jgi:hypothetical protein